MKCNNVIRALAILSLLPSQFALAQDLIEVRRFNSAQEKIGSVPALAEHSEGCFLPNEQEEYQSFMDRSRISYSGCRSEKYDDPPVTLNVGVGTAYEAGTQGAIYSCKKVRKDYFAGPSMDRFVSQVQDAVANASGKPVGDHSVLCALNLFYNAANKGAFTQTADAKGRMVAAELNELSEIGVGKLAIMYFKSLSIQDRALSQNKDKKIRSWLAKLGTQLSARMALRERQNNHRTNRQYTHGFAMLGIGLVSNRADFVETARGAFKNALLEIVAVPARAHKPTQEVALSSEDQGMIHAEMFRGNKSLQYSSMAARSLIGMAALSRAGNCNFIYSNWSRNQVKNMLVWITSAQKDRSIASDAVVRYGTNVDRKGVAHPVGAIEGGTLVSRFAVLANLADPRIIKDWRAVNLQEKYLDPAMNEVPSALGGGKISEWSAAIDRYNTSGVSICAPAESDEGDDA